MFRPLCLSLVLVLTVASYSTAAPADDMFNALGIAMKKVPAGSKLIQARAEGQSATSVYGFYFMYKTRVIEVEVSKDGQVVKLKDSDNDVVSDDVMKLFGKKGPAKIPDGRLMEIVKDTLKGGPFEHMKYEVIDGVLFMVVGNTLINTETGEVTQQMRTA